MKSKSPIEIYRNDGYKKNILYNKISHQVLKVCFAPQLGTSNPYQNQLSENLKGLGVQIQGIDVHKIFLPSAIKKFKPNLIHLHWLDTFFKAKSTVISLIKLIVFLVGLTFLKSKNIKIIWTAHNLKSHENYPNPLLAKIDYFCSFFVAKISDSIITHCALAKSELIKYFHMQNEDKICIVPHGNYIDCYNNTIDREQSRKILKISEKCFLFLFLGHIRPYKGIFELIETFKKIDDENVQLIIAGKPLDDEISKQVKQEIVDCSNVRLILEPIPEHKIQIYMNACDVIVLPYREILTSGAVVLAMSFSKVCIAPRLGCISETLDKSGAFLYDPKDASGLLKAMNLAIHSKTLLPSMGKHNFELANKSNWRFVANKTINVYQKNVR